MDVRKKAGLIVGILVVAIIFFFANEYSHYREFITALEAQEQLEKQFDEYIKQQDGQKKESSIWGENGKMLTFEQFKEKEAQNAKQPKVSEQPRTYNEELTRKKTLESMGKEYDFKVYLELKLQRTIKSVAQWIAG